MSAQTQTVTSIASDASRVAVRQLSPADEAKWDAYIMQHPAGEFFSLIAWKRVIEESYGYKPQYLIAERDDKVVGILPMFLVSNLVTGKKLISVPFAVYAGATADDQAAEDALHSEVRELGQKLKVDYVELRYKNHGAMEGWVPVEQYVTFTMALEANDEAMMKKLPRDTRYMVRKGQKAGLAGKHGLDQMDLFYRLFAQNMQNHGTPMFPRKYFSLMEKHLGAALDVLIIRDGDKPVAGVLSFLFKDAVLPYYAGVTDDARRVAGNNFMYWDLMSWSISRGIRHFDFGRSKKGTGAFDFKSGWGMDCKQLDYQMLLVQRKTAPNFSPTNSKFAAAAKVWARLPLGLTTFIGPMVAPWFP
jgi:FemAB-related protein (PEP-CTERM system-associated)